MTRNQLRNIAGSHGLPARDAEVWPSWDVSKGEEAEPTTFVRHGAPAMSVAPAGPASEPPTAGLSRMPAAFNAHSPAVGAAV